MDPIHPLHDVSQPFLGPHQPASTASLAGTYPAAESLLPAVESPTPATEGPRDSTDGSVPSVAGISPSVESFVPSVEGFSPSAEGLRESRSPTPLSPVSANPLTCLIERS